MPEATSTKLSRITELAKGDRERQFLSIAHLLTEEALSRAFNGLRKDASAGVDGVTYQEYAENVHANIQGLHGRIKNRQYRVQPLRRVYIPKGDGSDKRRPL